MPSLQAELIARLEAALPPSTTIGVLVLLNDTRSSFSFTNANVNVSTGFLTVAGHNFTDIGNGTRVQFPFAAPGGLTLNLDYWTRNVSGDEFQLSALPGGSAISSFSSAGSSTMTISDQALTATDQSLSAPSANNAQWFRKEVGNRISVSTPTSTSYTIDTSTGTIRAKVPLNVLVDNTAGSSTLNFTKGLLLLGGSMTSGDASGTPNRWWELSGYSVPAGQALGFTLNALDSN